MKVGDTVIATYLTGGYKYRVKIDEITSSGFKGKYQDITYSGNSAVIGPTLFAWSVLKSIEQSPVALIEPTIVYLDAGGYVTVDHARKTAKAAGGSYEFSKRDFENILETINK